MISIYTDGSSGAGGGKPGGWAFVIVRDEVEVLGADYGGSTSTTNNIMEATAAIEGLRAVLTRGFVGRGEMLELVSDSQYTLGIASGGYSPSKNLEIAKQLKDFAQAAGVRFRWVRGHTGNIWNERCDSLAGRGKREHTSPETLAKLDAKKFKKKKVAP